MCTCEEEEGGEREHVCMHVCVRVHARACVRERERARESESKRQREGMHVAAVVIDTLLYPIRIT